MSAGSAGSALAFVDTNIWLYAFSCDAVVEVRWDFPQYDAIHLLST